MWLCGRFKGSNLGKESSILLSSVGSKQRKSCHCLHFLTKTFSSWIFDGGERRSIISFSAFTVKWSVLSSQHYFLHLQDIAISFYISKAAPILSFWFYGNSSVWSLCCNLCSSKGSSMCEISHSHRNRTVSRSIYLCNSTCQSQRECRLLELCILTCKKKSGHEDDRCNLNL